MPVTLRCRCGLPIERHLRCHLCGALVGGAVYPDAHSDHGPLLVLVFCGFCRRALQQRGIPLLGAPASVSAAGAPEPDSLLTVSDAAKLVHLQPATVRRLIRSGELESMQRRRSGDKRGNRHLVRKADVQALLVAQSPQHPMRPTPPADEASRAGGPGAPDDPLSPTSSN